MQKIAYMATNVVTSWKDIKILFGLLNGPLTEIKTIREHGSVSLCRDGQKTKWRLQCKYWRSNADISPGGGFYASEDS